MRHGCCCRQHATGRGSTEPSGGGGGAGARARPLESKRPSHAKPLQKVAPHLVKRVVAEVVQSIEQTEVADTCSKDFTDRCVLFSG